MINVDNGTKVKSRTERSVGSQYWLSIPASSMSVLYTCPFATALLSSLTLAHRGERVNREARKEVVPSG
jgi:hypothetical protein